MSIGGWKIVGCDQTSSTDRRTDTRGYYLYSGSPLSDSIAFDGLSEAMLFQESEAGKVLPKTVTLSASHNPYFRGPPQSVSSQFSQR